LPNAIHELRGNPGKRPLNKHEPKPERKMPRMPDLVKSDERAKKHWKRLAPMLLRMKCLTEADAIALANLCLDMSTLEQAQEKLQKTGLLVKTDKTGAVHQNPLLRLIAETSTRVSRGLREFGMTPSSRARIVVPHAHDPNNRWAKLMEAS